MSKKTIILGIVTLLWMGVIFYMSNDSGEDSGNKSGDIINFIVSKYDQITNASIEKINYHNSIEFKEKANYIFRKVCHFSEYFVLSILLINWFISLSKYTMLSSSIWTIIISIVYALLDEYHQTFISGRSGNIIDSMIDTSGAITGTILVIIIYYIINKNNMKTKNS